MGFVAWYPAIGLVMALMLASVRGMRFWPSSPMLSPTSLFILSRCFRSVIPSVRWESLPVMGLLHICPRGTLKIDLSNYDDAGDVVRYPLVSAIAAASAALFGVATLIADHAITWGEWKSSALGWFLGDAIGLVGCRPLSPGTYLSAYS